MRGLHLPLKAMAALGLIMVAACSKTDAQQTTLPNQSEVVATVGTSQVTLAEVDTRALQEPVSSFGSAKLVQALYMARRATIEEIVANRLIDDEAKARGIDRPTLVEREIASKAPAPTEAEIAAWFQANQARVNGATLDQVRAPIKSMLIEQRMDVARAALVDALKAKTTVTISLEPPRVEVTDGGRVPRGNAKAAHRPAPRCRASSGNTTIGCLPTPPSSATPTSRRTQRRLDWTPRSSTRVWTTISRSRASMRTWPRRKPLA